MKEWVDSALCQLWDRKAREWDERIGDEGDRNRVLCSDPVLWRMIGEVKGLDVLDAGCGTGYLCRKLARKGALPVGVDFSSDMIRIAKQRAKSAGISSDYHTCSCACMEALADESFDLLTSNYVLMDLRDHLGAVAEFYRVLRPGGRAVIIFSHPCFPGGRAIKSEGKVSYPWDFSYFEKRPCVDEPWGNFTSHFVFFHRPISDYWKAFTGAGFTVLDFEEPRLGRDQIPADKPELEKYRHMPLSVAFHLQKPGGVLDQTDEELNW